MNALKSILFTLLLLTLALTGYIFFKFDNDYFLRASAKAYSRKEYAEAERILTLFKDKKPPKAYLYQGYVLRAQKKPSSNAFKLAYEKANTPALKQEAIFNLLLNAYINKEYVFIEKYLEKDSETQVAALFAALLHYQDKEFEEAYHYFCRADIKEYPSAFMQKEFSKYFPKLFLVSRKAHCLIELGKPAQGRQLLEQTLKEFDDPDYHISHLIGWTYLKEAESLPIDHAGSYYTEARKFFKKLSSNDKSRLTKYLSKKVSECKALEDTESFITLLNLAKSTKAVDEEFSKASLDFFEQIAENLEVHEFTKVYDTLYDFESSKKLLLERGLFENYLLTWIDEEEGDLSITYDLLLHWDQLERSDEKRLVFLQALFPKVRELWDENPEKALQLSKYLDQFSHRDQKGIVQQSMLDILKDVSAKFQNKEEKEAYLYFNPLITR